MLIPTYNRPQMLLSLLRQIKEQFTCDVRVKVYNDCSTENYGEVERYLENFDHYYRRTNFNYGKRYYWKLTSIMYEELMNEDFDLFIQLADDLDLIDNFQERVLEQWSAAQTGALNILVSNGSFKMWHRQGRKKIERNGFKFWKIKWIDGCFVADKTFFTKIGYQCPEIPEHRFWKTPNRSSGVGSALSYHFHRNRGEILVTYKSLVIHRGMESKMNPERTGDTTSLIYETQTRGSIEA